MAVLPLVIGENTKILRTVCSEVKSFDKKLKQLVEDMKDTMNEAKGIGIAAPQVGVDARVFLAMLNSDSKSPKTVEMVNPKITYLSEETNVAEEGCLSLPKQFGEVVRASEIIVEFQNVKGKPHVLKLHNLDARVVQHELDHLNGVLFLDRL